jgi:hypothetical protein
MSLDLIDKQDNFEIARDEIAAILAFETVNQQAKATLAGKDADLWKFSVYIERARIWESLRADDVEPVFPVVNIWYELGTFNRSKSRNTLQQAHEATYNIDIFSSAISVDLPGSGFISGDEQSAKDNQRIVRLIRNILMSVEYRYLNLRGIVWGRWIQTINMFQPEVENETVNVMGSRISFMVTVSETVQEPALETLDVIQTQVKRAEDGAILFELTIDTT